jgi:nucleoside-diphosphate-sugar epimerase
MPVIVVGADTEIGLASIEGLLARQGEVRAFVSDPTIGASLKERGVKVALGDVSDSSHVEAAALYCFSAVLIGEAAYDDRERSFASTPKDVIEEWASAVAAAGVRRRIWVVDNATVGLVPDAPGVEQATVSYNDRPVPDVAAEVVGLDDAVRL